MSSYVNNQISHILCIHRYRSSPMAAAHPGRVPICQSYPQELLWHVVLCRGAAWFVTPCSVDTHTCTRHSRARSITRCMRHTVVAQGKPCRRC